MNRSGRLTWALPSKAMNLTDPMTQIPTPTEWQRSPMGVCLVVMLVLFGIALLAVTVIDRHIVTEPQVVQPQVGLEQQVNP